jgi:hypothetical protein
MANTGRESKHTHLLFGDAVFVEAALLRIKSEKTNVPSSLTGLLNKPSLVSEQVLLLTLSGPLN